LVQLPPQPAAHSQSDEQLIALCRTELETKPAAPRAARLHYEIARSLQDREHALANYQRAIELLPDHLPSIRAARRILLANRDAKHAVPLYDAEIRLTEEPPAKARLQFHKGRALEDLNSDLDGARACYGRATELDATNPTYAKALEQSEWQAGAWERLSEARERTANAVREDPRHRAAIVIERARLLETRLGQPEQAADLYKHALDIDGEAAGALEALKRLLYAQGRWRELNQVLERIALKSTDPKLQLLSLFQVGQNHAERMGNRDEAIKALSRAMQVTTGDVLVLEALARLYRDAADSQSLAHVLAHQVETIDTGRDRLGLLQRIGKIYERDLGDDDSAQGWYEAALQIDAAYLPALDSLDALYRRTQGWESLIVSQMAAIEASSDSDWCADAHARIAEIFETRVANVEEAIRHHARALALAPGLEGSFKALIRLYSQNSMHRELIELLERGIDQAEEQDVIVTYLFRMGALFEDRLGDPVQAIYAYRRILDLRPDELGAIHAIQRAAERAYRHAELVEAIEMEAELTNDKARRVALIHRAAQVLADDVGDTEAAVQRFRAVLVLDRRYAPSLASLAKLHQSLGRHEDLLDIYQRQLELLDKGPSKVALLYTLGQLCELQLADDKLAVGYYQKAISIDGSHGPSLRALSQQFRRRKDYKGLADTIAAEFAAAGKPHTKARAAFRLGEVYEVHLQQLDKAEAAYAQALAAVPDYLPAGDALRRVQTATKNWPRVGERLASEAEGAVEASQSIAALLRAAEIWSELLHQPQQAINCYEQVLRIDESNLLALLGLEPLYRRAGAWDELARVYLTQEGVLSDPRARVTVLEELARLYESYGIGDDGDRSRTYNAILSIDGEHPVALAGLEGIALETNNRLLLAEVDTRAARCERHPSVVAMHFARLGRSLERGSPRAAMAAYRSALEKDSDSIASILGLGRAAKKSADPQGMVESLRREASFTHDGERAAGALVRSARVRLESQQDPKGALEDAERALERHPDSPDAMRMLSDLLREAGDIDRLISLLTHAAGAAKIDERVAALWRAVARLYAQERNDVGAALAALQRMLKTQQPDAATVCLLGELYGRNRQFKQAIETFGKAMQLKPTREQAINVQLQLAAIYSKELGDKTAAIKALNTLVSYDDKNRDALLMLLELQGQTNDNAGRRDTLAGLLAISGNPEEQAWTMLELGRLDFHDGRKNEAAKALRGAVAFEGPNGEAASLYKKLLGESEPWDRYAGALTEHLRRVQTGELRDDQLRDTYLELSRLKHEVLLQSDAALNILREGLHACQGDDVVHLELAERLCAAGRSDDAVVEYRSIIDGDPTNVDAWRGMARAFHEAGRKLEAGVALAPLVVLGKATDIESGMSRQRRLNPGQAQPGSFDAEALLGISAGRKWEDERMESLLSTIGEGVAKLYPTDFDSYGVSSRDRVSDHPLRSLAEQIAQAFGVEEFDLYLHGSATSDVVAELCQPAAIMVPNYVSKLERAEQVFLLARAFAVLTRGIHPVVTLGRREIARLVASSMQGVDPGYASDRYPDDELSKLHKRLHKALSRKARRNLEAVAQEFTRDRKVDIDSWAPTVGMSSIRAAALIANDLPASIAALKRAGDKINGEGEAMVEGSPVIADLLRFWPSKAAFACRRAAGVV
jgi:tetratricopeptide (TPR) repeat protein